MANTRDMSAYSHPLTYEHDISFKIGCDEFGSGVIPTTYMKYYKIK